MVFHLSVEGSNRFLLFSTLQFDLENKEIVMKKKEMFNIILEGIRKFDLSDEDMEFIQKDIKNEIEKRKK